MPYPPAVLPSAPPTRLPNTAEGLWQLAVLRAAQQGMEDLTVAGVAEVVFLRARRASAASSFFDALSPSTALRALGELSRLVRAIGFRGVVMIFEGAEVLTRLSASRRDGAYTVLRELVDNADGARGLVSAQLWVGATPLLFDGA